jgi:hypothetical protein
MGARAGPDFLATGATAAALAAGPSRALAQTPKRGGTVGIDARLHQKEYCPASTTPGSRETEAR